MRGSPEDEIGGGFDHCLGGDQKHSTQIKDNRGLLGRGGDGYEEYTEKNKGKRLGGKGAHVIRKTENYKVDNKKRDGESVYGSWN